MVMSSVRWVNLVILLDPSLGLFVCSVSSQDQRISHPVVSGYASVSRSEWNADLMSERIRSEVRVRVR